MALKKLVMSLLSSITAPTAKVEPQRAPRPESAALKALPPLPETGDEEDYGRSAYN
jgi:hypothetical protein